MECLYVLTLSRLRDAILIWQYYIANWHGKHKLEISILIALKGPLLLPAIPRLVLIGFTFCQPLLVRRFLSFLQSEEQDVNIGKGLIGGYALVYLGIAVCCPPRSISSSYADPG